jgi:tetratricopeptide (TPR) repeat protein
MKTNVLTVIQLAICYLNLKKYQEAEDIITRHSNAGNNPALYYYLGLSYSLQGKFDEAIEALNNHLSSGQDSVASRELIFQLYINKAQTALGNADYGSLSDILTNAIKFSPENEESAKILSHFESVLPVSYIKNGEREKAAKIWIDELKKESFSNPDTIHNLALLYYWWALANEKDILNDKSDESKNKRVMADYLWSQTFMYWFTFINSQAYWENLCKDRSIAWKEEITPNDFKTVKSEISRDKILKVLEGMLDSYRQKEQADFNRIQNYIINYHFEKKTASYWMEFHEILLNNIKSLDSDLSKTADRIIKLKGPYTLSFIRKHFSDHKLVEDVMTVTGMKLASGKDKELFENIRLAFNYPSLSKIALTIREIKDIENATRLWEELKDREGKAESGFLNKSAEAQFISALISFAKGNQFISNHEVLNACREWKNTFQFVKNASDKDKNKNCHTLLANFKSQLSETITDACLQSAKKLNAALKYDEAIAVLEAGLELTKMEPIRDLLCSNYCGKGHQFLKEKKFAKANVLFEKALSLDKKYSAALRGLSISKNNEGMEALNNNNYDKAIELLERAMELDKDDVVSDNLARAYNQKAVKILNALGNYSSTYQCDQALDLIEKGLELLNPKIEVRSLISTFQYYEEFQFNNIVRNLPEDIYKTMLHNLWVAARSKRNIRGY